MKEVLRRRNVTNGQTEFIENDLSSHSDLDRKRGTPVEHLGLSGCHFVIVLTFHLVLFALAVYAHHYVPPARKTVRNIDFNNRSTALNGDFAEWLARVHLEKITSYGRRPTGSYANENQTVSYLVDTLRSFKASASEDVVLEIDVQRPTGTFAIDFLEGFTSYYRNLTNVVVRLSSKSNYPARDSVLVNAHFDTAFGGAGASDDAVSCAAMLEVIRCLTQSHGNRLHHSVVFLFNGAEENFLQGSHGFITQHPWAADVRVFINLEAAGAGGRELVFQTGPEHPWLIKIYANSANYPYANVVGQEIFQTGLIPADTDFRIFRDYGNIPGIDIAYVTNGYVYHTSRDLPEAITHGSVQRAGDNLLEMVKQLSSSPLVADPSQDRHGAMVFYDFLGLFLVIYPQRIGFILNTLVAVVTYVCICLKFFRRPVNGEVADIHEPSRTNWMENLSFVAFIKALVVISISNVISVLFVFAIAQGLTTAGYSLSWYCRPYFLIGIYVIPGIVVMAAIHYFHATKFRSEFSWSARWNQEAHVFYASLFLWNTLLSIMTYYDLGSAFLPVLFVAFPLLIRLFLWKVWLENASSQKHVHRNRFVVMHLISTAVPVLISSYIVWMHVEFIVPILGRTGTNDPPDVVISTLVSLSSVVIVSYSISLIYVVRRVKPFALVLTGVWICSLAAILLGIVFPYSAQPWCPKRVIFQHTSRVLHDARGQVSHRDSGLWVVPFDYLGIKHIDHLPEFEKAENPDLDQGLFGDFPYYIPVNFMFDKTWYIPGPAPVISKVSTVTLVSQKNQPRGYLRLNFEVDGPSHMSVYLSPKAGVELLSSTFGDLYHRYIPRMGLAPREEYFVFYSHGIYTGPWHFWIDVKPSRFTENLVDIGIVGHYVDGDDSKSKYTDDFLKKLPDWVDATAWVCTYEKWTF